MTFPIIRKRNKADAFTLLELLLALTILGILVAAAIPNAGRSIRRMALRDAAYTLAANIRYAQAKAITEGMPTRIIFHQVDGKYYLEFAPDTLVLRFRRLPGEAGGTFRLPEDVAFTRLELVAEDGVTGVEALTFYPDGRGGLAKIELSGPEGKFGIAVTRRLGRITVKETTGGEEVSIDEWQRKE